MEDVELMNMDRLMAHIENNNIWAVTKLIATGVNVNGVDGDGRSPLIVAAEEGHAECVTALLDANADVHQAHDDTLFTPLHMASFRGRVECVRVSRWLSGWLGREGSWCLHATDVLLPLQVLLQRKADVNFLEVFGRSPISWASSLGHLTCVQVRLLPLEILVVDVLVI